MKNPKYLHYVPKRIGIFGLCILASCSTKTETLFTPLPVGAAGIGFQNTLTEGGPINILDYLYFYNGGGTAMGDINNDGLPDLFFSANQKPNGLYLNKGNLTFENITKKAGVQGNSSWNTAAVMADVNADGWLDIYVTAVVGIHGFTGHNELYINNKDNTFTEMAAAHGLDIQAFCTTANFFDYDLDGDLDLFLLNHAVHTEGSFGKASLREKRDKKTGDRLLRNDNGHFNDVSIAAGIYGGINGYGLGLSVADFNSDGYPDIYVGNDFHEDDYYYINNGNGTFTNKIKQFFGHTSRFSMGNDVADINHDGRPDLISLDMLPEDETVLKSSEGDDTYQTLQMRTQQYGYHYQYSRNMLFLNGGGNPFSETALLAGVAATDWSWSALFGDYDQDGEQDLFISNGIPKRPNNSDFVRFVSNGKIKATMNKTRLVDRQALQMMPSGAVHNYYFKGNGDGSFNNISQKAIPNSKTVSGATAVGDLDNDGDLDIVTNNLNGPPGIYINNTNTSARFLKLKFNSSAKNPFGIGTKAFVYHNGKLQFKQLFPNRGWQASSEPMLHFGLGTVEVIDSVKIIWPDRAHQVLKNVKTNQQLAVSPKNVQLYDSVSTKTKPFFKKVKGNLGLTFTHREDPQTDFDHQKLIPYQVSDQGPAVAVGDINNDGRDDVFLGGAKNQPASIYLQRNGTFKKTEVPTVANDSVYEDVAAVISKNPNGAPVITVASGGNNVLRSVAYLRNRSFQDHKDKMVRAHTDSSTYNTATVAISDTGTVFFGNHSTAFAFGETTPSYYSENGKMKTFPYTLNMVTAAVWDDFNNNGRQGLIVVGEWMPPRFFEHKDGTFVETFPLQGPLNGLWQTIMPFDIDHDGDTDYLLGNWGLNTKFKASANAPLKMYYADFDNNGTHETILAIEKNGMYYPLHGLPELSGQLVHLRKKYNSFKSFAGKTVTEVFGAAALKNATVFEVDTLPSGYLLNTNNTFTFTAFPNSLQTAPLRAFCVSDFNGDGRTEALAAGNYFGVTPFHGRFDAFNGAMIKSTTEIITGERLGLAFANRAARSLKTITVGGKTYLLAVFNNDTAEFYEIEK